MSRWLLLLLLLYINIVSIPSSAEDGLSDIGALEFSDLIELADVGLFFFFFINCSDCLFNNSLLIFISDSCIFKDCKLVYFKEW